MSSGLNERVSKRMNATCPCLCAHIPVNSNGASSLLHNSSVASHGYFRMPRTQLMEGKGSEALAAGGIRARETCLYFFPPRGWGYDTRMCMLLCTNPPAFIPPPITGHLLCGGHCKECREELTRAVTLQNCRLLEKDMQTTEMKECSKAQRR